MHDHIQKSQVDSSSRLNRTLVKKYILFLAVAFAAYFLYAEHREHTLGILPYVILLLCPLMHFFMHRRHGGQHGPH
jgi:hypothetical protein